MTSSLPLHTQVDPTPMPYRGKPRRRAFFSRHSPLDRPALLRLKEDCGLSMGLNRLEELLTQLNKENRPASMETIYLADAYAELFSRRPEHQLLMGLETADPAHADALSTLICRSRSHTTDNVTPPQTLRTVLDAICDELNATLPPRPYDRDAALHFTLCDTLDTAVLPLRGLPATRRLYAPTSPWCLIAHAPATPPNPPRILRKDVLCLICGKGKQPCAEERAAAEGLFAALCAQGLRRVVSAQPSMLLPCALELVPGLIVHHRQLPPREDGTPLQYPCELLTDAPGGWIAVLDPAVVSDATALCERFGLRLFAFGTAQSHRQLTFDTTYNGQSVSLPAALLSSLRLSYAYRITEQPAAPVEHTCEPLSLLHMRSDFGHSDADLSPTQHCASFALRTIRLPLEAIAHPDTLRTALDRLRTALEREGCTVAEASVAVGMELAPDFSRRLLWQAVLQLFCTLRDAALPCLPIVTHHAPDKDATVTVSLLCRLPQPAPDVSGSNDTTTPEPTLPLPHDCSLLHTKQPRALVVHSPSAGEIGGIARVLTRAGAKVVTLAPAQDSATVLADAIRDAELVVFVGGNATSDELLQHRRVTYALQELLRRDGLCLGIGNAAAPLCRCGLLGDEAREATFSPACDLEDGRFPYPVHLVQALDGSTPARLRAIVGDVLRSEALSIGDSDPLLSVFRAAPASALRPIAVAERQGEYDAVAFTSADGHVILRADGFTPAELASAVKYFL